MKTFLIAASAAFMLAACSGGSPEAEVDPVTVESSAPSLMISDGYVMAPLKGRDVAAGYFVVENQGAETRLVAASSPMATVEIHTHGMVDGVMKMRQVEAVDLPENASVAFEPGGFHLMMFGFTEADGQTDVPVTLTLSTGEDLIVSLPIRERD